jgi:preprotein translocase subunit YajC
LLFSIPVLLGQDAETGAASGGGSQAFVFQLLTLWLPIGVLFYFFFIRPGQRDRKKREGAILALKPNDRVVTIGGIHGVVSNVNREGDAIVTIKVDEATNTRLRVSLGAIARVLVDEPSRESPSKKEKD